MNLPKFLKMVENETSKMTRDNLVKSIQIIARGIPDVRRGWFLCVLNGEYQANEAYGKAVSADLYEQLEKIISGEYHLDSDYIGDRNICYDDENSDFIFEDNCGLLPIIEKACAELHRLVQGAEYTAASRLGQLLLNLEVQVDGPYSEYYEDTMNIEELETYELIPLSANTVLLDIGCSIYFSSSGQERVAALYKAGSRPHYYLSWTLEELMQYSPEELPDFDEFLKEWISYLQTISTGYADEYLDEALEMLNDPDSVLEIARQSAVMHPKLYLDAFAMQDNDNARLAVGTEALDSIDINYTFRSEIALQTAEVVLRLGNVDCAIHCRKEAFRSDSTTVNFFRALLNAPDYENTLSELKLIVTDFTEPPYDRYIERNRLDEGTKRLIDFLTGEFQNAYADLFGKYNSYTHVFLDQGMALIALFLYPDDVIREGGKAMLSTLEVSMSFTADKYFRGLGMCEYADNSDVLWDCLKKCRRHTPLPDRESAIDILQKHCIEYTEYVMKWNLRDKYSKCAAYAAVIGEILEAEGKIPSKNSYMSACKQKYSRRTAYHRELRHFGMID